MYAVETRCQCPKGWGNIQAKCYQIPCKNMDNIKGWEAKLTDALQGNKTTLEMNLQLFYYYYYYKNVNIPTYVPWVFPRIL